MRARTLIILFLFATISCEFFFLSTVPHAHAENVTLYAQSDDSGEMLTQQAMGQNAWITSESLGNLYLGKDRLIITFTMKDPHANTVYHSPFGGVAMGTCSGCFDLQKYYFTDADRTLLKDGQFHTFTVQTGTTTLGIADGETPIYITFFSLSQYYLGTHVKSNSASTIPAIRIEAAAFPPPPDNPQAPEGSITIYEQSDKSSVMSNPQPTNLNSYIDSANLGNLNVGQGQLYLTFSIKSPATNNISHMPNGVCLEQASTNCSKKLQTYYFTDADRALLSDGAFHTFTVLTGTTTSTYADGTRPVNIGFFGLYQIQYKTKVKSNSDATIPYLSIKKPPPPPDPCVASNTCYSNVLFLPGIEGSRLYEGTGCGKEAEEKLWEPYDSFLKAVRGAGDTKVKNLFLDQTGESACSDVYTKEGDVIDSVSGSNIYASLIAQMNGLKADGTINDWKPVAYDWRLSFNDLLTKGTKRNGNIYYEEATSTPYIEQTLRALASSSKSKKVTIVAHSNGGLLTKALLNKLGDEAATLVDKIILVGAPQSGAPEALGVTLLGHNAGMYSYGVTIVSNAVARELAQNSPMAYHLLPSQNYFDSVMDDYLHPVARFAGDAYAKEISAYGPVIGTQTELDDFLLAKDGGREKPKTTNLNSAEILNPSLINYANSTHSTLDAWVPPAGIAVSQIAGWGVDTVSGIDFYTSRAVSALTSSGPVREYKPIFTEDGDGTVPVPSALMVASSTNVKRYWVNLESYFRDVSIKRDHKDLFEIPSLREFIKNIIINSTSTPPTYISTTQPAPLKDNKKLTFYLHSPLTLELTDASGNVTGIREDGTAGEDIPDSTYGEFGEVKYISVPAGNAYTLAMHGQDTGTFSLDIEESSGGVVTASSSVANVPATASTLASLTISNGIDTASALTVDEDGDGKNIITITPVVGETVSYEPPAPEPEPEPDPEPTPVHSSGAGGYSAYVPAGSISIPVITPAPITIPPLTIPIESTVVINTPVIATSTQEMPTTTERIIEAKKKTVKSISMVTKVPKEKVLKEVKVIPQTASVYDASQQPVLQKLGEAVYNGLQWIWSLLTSIF